MGLPLKGSGKSIIDEHIRRDAANQPGIDGPGRANDVATINDLTGSRPGGWRDRRPRSSWQGRPEWKVLGAAAN
jgi:hypothetical protein